MTAHRAATDMYAAPLEIADPGNAGSINVDRNPSVCNLTSAGAETRTLARPTRSGASLTIAMVTDAGDITLTVTGGFNEDGDTTFVFSDVGQFMKLVSLVTSAGVFFWRKVSDYASGNIAPADAAILATFGDLTATVAEINQAADVSAQDEIVITTNVITAAESGRTFYLTLAGGFLSTLPAPALGLKFRFIVAVAPTTAYIIKAAGGSGGANIIYGMFVERAGGAGVAGAAQDTVNFVANLAIIGDWAEFYSDGTNWYVHGMVDAIAGVTFAVT